MDAVRGDALDAVGSLDASLPAGRTALTDWASRAQGLGFFSQRANHAMVLRAGSHPGRDGTLDPRKLDHPARAKRVIFLFMNGGLSQVDSFDPKPMLDKYHGQPLPGGTIATERRTGALMRSPFTFKKYGQCGMDVSDWLPNLATCVDDIAFVRSMYTTDNDHAAEFQMHNGRHMLDEPQPDDAVVLQLVVGHRLLAEEVDQRQRDGIDRRLDPQVVDVLLRERPVDLNPAAGDRPPARPLLRADGAAARVLPVALRQRRRHPRRRNGRRGLRGRAGRSRAGRRRPPRY